MTDKKIKILTLSDHPLSPSGVGTQTKYIIDGMLKTGKYEFISFGGAIKHDSYQPQKTEQYGDDWIIMPVDGYGNQGIVRSCIREHKPDMLWFMTDPRFYSWLWAIENEIRPHIENKNEVKFLDQDDLDQLDNNQYSTYMDELYEKCLLNPEKYHAYIRSLNDNIEYCSDSSEDYTDDLYVNSD